MLSFKKPKSSATLPASTGNASRKRRTPEYFPIAYKLAIIITLLISSGMILLGLVIVAKQTQLLRVQMNHFGHAVVNQLSESSEELVLSDDILSLMVVISNLGDNKNILGTAVYADNGKILASSGLLPSDGVIQLYTKSEQIDDSSFRVKWKTTSESGEHLDMVSFMSPIRYQDVIAGHVLVTFSEELMNEAIQATLRSIITATVLMIILGVIISFIMGKKISQPIHTLMNASKAIGAGQYDYRIRERRNDEIGYLTEAFNKMANDLLEKSQVENAFSRFVSPNVAKQIMANLDQIQLGGKHVDGTVLFADIVGFTSLSEKRPADEIAELLNEYFSHIALVSQRYRGTIDKYMGDCVMVVFGVPESDEEHKFNAIACGIMIQRLVEQLNKERIEKGKYPIHFRIGVNSGKMLAGNMGSSQRMQYTVVGESVNLASRLHTAAEKGQVIITEHLYLDADVQQRIHAKQHKSIQLRGIAAPVSTYIVTDVVEENRSDMDLQINEILSRKNVA